MSVDKQIEEFIGIYSKWEEEKYLQVARLDVEILSIGNLGPRNYFEGSNYLMVALTPFLTSYLDSS